ncbi:MAG: EamA family transporter, partial [Oscillospiraceae bacterium]|nr:EamA family transporter [Oscillospiraceae bacterium]
MRFFEKRPMAMIVLGVVGISLSSIFVKFSTAPAAVTAAWRLLWTVALMTPVVWGRGAVRRELLGVKWPLAALSALSGLFLAIHFVLWFESLNRTSVASSTTIVCTEVIWVCLGWWLFMGGRVPGKALAAIGVTVVGSVVIAFADSGSRGHLSGD